MNKKIFALVLGLGFVLVPLAFTYAAPIVPSCNTGAIDLTTGQYKNACDFTYFMTLINSIINFLLFTIATPLVALIIAYVGFLFLTASGNPSKSEQAKHILSNVVIGYVVALAAWLIINTILSSLGVDTAIGSMFLKK